MGSNIACKPISLKSGYFELMWQQGDSAEVMFGFLHEGQHNQWKKIAQLTEEWASGQSGKQTKAVFFRTAELSKVPKANWKAAGEIIEKAMQRNLELITLTSEETARLYSARDLYKFFARPLEALPRPELSSTRCAQHFTYSAALMLTIRD